MADYAQNLSDVKDRQARRQEQDRVKSAKMYNDLKARPLSAEIVNTSITDTLAKIDQRFQTATQNRQNLLS